MLHYRPFAISIIVVTQIICGMKVEAYARVIMQGGKEMLQSNSEDNSHLSSTSSEVTSQLRGRAIQSSSDMMLQQQQQQAYLMKPHSLDSKMIVYPSSSYVDGTQQRRNDMASSIDFDQDIRRLKKPLPKPEVKKPMKSGYQYAKPTTEQPPPVPSTESLSHFLPTIIPENHALYFNKDYLPPFEPTTTTTTTTKLRLVEFLLNEYNLAVSKNNIKDELMKELSKKTPDKNVLPPKSDSGSSEEEDGLPLNHQSSYDSPNMDGKVPIGTSYIPPASGPVKVYPVYSAQGTESPSSNAFPPNIDVPYDGLPFKLHPGTSYIPPASGIPGQIIHKPQGFTARPTILTTTKKPSNDYLAPNLHEINQMSVYDPDNAEDLSAFPPNINSHYETSGRIKNVPVTSYLPPPSGHINDDKPPSDAYLPPKHSAAYPPNIDIEYLPPEMMTDNFVGDSYIPPPSGNVNDVPSVNYLPPPPISTTTTTTTTTTTPIPLTSTMTQTVKPTVMISYLPPPSAAPPMMLPTPLPPISYLPPKPEYLPPGNDYLPPEPPKPMPPPPMMMPMPMPKPALPPGMVWDVPSGWKDSEIVFDDPHHGHHDHDHHFDYHDFHHHEIITTPPPPPPPPPPPISSLKKYGHYYILIKLWYIPLLFTIWVSFYIAFILLKSLGRHKAYWPNHTSLKKRSINDNPTLEAISNITAVKEIGRMSHRDITDRVDALTCKVQTYIDGFMCKYL